MAATVGGERVAETLEGEIAEFTFPACELALALVAPPPPAPAVACPLARFDASHDAKVDGTVQPSLDGGAGAEDELGI
eukprot:tig00000480_g1295.t1